MRRDGNRVLLSARVERTSGRRLERVERARDRISKVSESILFSREGGNESLTVFLPRSPKPGIDRARSSDRITVLSISLPYRTVVSFCLQVLSALDILQPPHLDFFQEMYPFPNTRTRGKWIFRRDREGYSCSRDIQSSRIIGEQHQICT